MLQLRCFPEPRAGGRAFLDHGVVALDTAVALVKLQQQLQTGLFKEWARLVKQDRGTTFSLNSVDDELHKAWQSHGETTVVGDLRAMVAQTLGLPLDGHLSWRFDKALFQLMGPPPRKRRARCRFTLAEGWPSYRDVFEQDTQG